jgi:hypothetical protein
MKSLIGICLISTTLAGCSSDRFSSTTRPGALATTQAVEEGQAASGSSRTPSLMEHRFVSVPVDGATTQPTRSNRYPAQQRWTSATMETEFPFTELLPSWNVAVPENAGVRWDVRVRDAKSGEWSPWLYIGYWGRVTHDRRTTEFADGDVEIDVLRLKSPADAFELRSTTMSFDLAEGRAMPSVRKVQAVYSRPLEENVVVSAPKLPTRVDLDVPFRAQGVEDKSISGSICSPTSVSMLLEWAGIDRPTAQNALAIWDDDYAIFGNWNRAVQYAASLGLESQVERFTTMDEVRARLASGQPIIASINFEDGTFPSNVMKSTDGHLIVIRGYDEKGDLIVNDPASKDRGNGIVYQAKELSHAWLVNTGGVGYVIKKPAATLGRSK